MDVYKHVTIVIPRSRTPNQPPNADLSLILFSNGKTCVQKRIFQSEPHLYPTLLISQLLPYKENIKLRWTPTAIRIYFEKGFIKSYNQSKTLWIIATIYLEIMKAKNRHIKLVHSDKFSPKKFYRTAYEEKTSLLDIPWLMVIYLIWLDRQTMPFCVALKKK